MKAISYSAFGGPEVLDLIDMAAPVPGPNQVRILVRSAAVNGLDWKKRNGWIGPVAFPAVPGLDAAGVVDAVGEGAAASVGDEVFGSAVDGSYAEQAILAAFTIKPATVSFDLAAAVVTVGETAVRALGVLGATAGDTLVIHGAAGSVGAIATQLAVRDGVTVIGSVAPKDFDRVSGFGATPVAYGPGLIERVRDIAPNGVDFVFDTSGHGVLADSIELTGDPTRVVTIADMHADDLGVYFAGPGKSGGYEWGCLPMLAELLADNALEVAIAATYPLADAATAQSDGESGVTGKLILHP